MTSRGILSGKTRTFHNKAYQHAIKKLISSCRQRLSMSCRSLNKISARSISSPNLFQTTNNKKLPVVALLRQKNIEMVPSGKKRSLSSSRKKLKNRSVACPPSVENCRAARRSWPASSSDKEEARRPTLLVPVTSRDHS